MAIFAIFDRFWFATFGIFVSSQDVNNDSENYFFIEQFFSKLPNIVVLIKQLWSNLFAIIITLVTYIGKFVLFNHFRNFNSA